MVSDHRPKSGHITCYLNRTYPVLQTNRNIWVGELNEAGEPGGRFARFGL
jgi:hypothetical protein